MFDAALRLLLSGAFVCETTAPAEYRYLQHETNQRLADEYLKKIGRRLAATGTGQAYFMAYADVGSGERPEIRRLFSEIKHDLRPLVNFLRFIMQTLRREETPTPGERIDFPAVFNAVSASPQLANELRGFATLGKDYTATDASVRGMLDKVFQQMTKGGYLLKIDQEREVYAFTGKIGYLYEVIEFLLANEQIAEEASDEASEQFRFE